jgi:hypothetical protein
MSFSNRCSVLKTSKLFLKLVYSVECEETGKKTILTLIAAYYGRVTVSCEEII